MFNENRSCIEINFIKTFSELKSCLMKTEVVLKLKFTSHRITSSICLMKTEVVLKCR